MPDTNSAAETPLNERLKAVWLTYRTRQMMWCVAATLIPVVAILILMMLTSQSVSQQDRRDGTVLPGVAILAAAAALALQAKSQFVTPSARLLPGYRPAHLWWLRGMAFGALLVLPLMAAFALRLAPLGVTALALLLGAGVVWTFHKPATALLVLPLYFSMYHPLVRAFWLDPEVNSWKFQTPLLAFGVWAVFRWLRRLDELNEEDPDYSIPPIAAGFARPSRSERAEQRKLAAKQFGSGANLNDRPIDRALTRGGLSCYALMRLTLIPSPTWFRGLFMATLFGAMPLVMSFWLGGEGKSTAPLFSMPILMTIFMPGVVASQAIDLKRPLLETELLRPVGRRAYFSDLFRAMLAEAAILTAFFVGVTCFFIALFAPDLITPRRLAVYLAWAPATNLLFVAINLWLAARYSGLLRFVIQMLIMMIVGALGVLSLIDPETLPGIPASLPIFVGAAILLAGVLVLRSAYGRWLTMEVG